MFDLIAGGVLGGALGGLLGGKTSSKKNSVAAQIEQLVNRMNDNLTKYLNMGMGEATKGTNKAIDELRAGNEQARTDLTQNWDAARRAATLNSIFGLRSAQAAVNPYISMGNRALDAYQQSLGLGTPVGGTDAQWQAGANQAFQAQQQQMLNTGFGQGAMPPTMPFLQQPGQAPTRTVYQPTQEEINKVIRTRPLHDFIHGIVGSGISKDLYEGKNEPAYRDLAVQFLRSQQQPNLDAQYAQANQAFQIQQQAYQQQLPVYNQQM